MSYVIRLVETVAGVKTEFDGKYVMGYDPTYCEDGQPYDGGILLVTGDVSCAMQFSSAAAAMTKYTQPFGIRADGRPNRPLTAWTVEVMTMEDALHGTAAMERRFINERKAVG